MGNLKKSAKLLFLQVLNVEMSTRFQVKCFKWDYFRSGLVTALKF